MYNNADFVTHNDTDASSVSVIKAKCNRAKLSDLQSLDPLSSGPRVQCL